MLGCEVMPYFSAPPRCWRIVWDCNYFYFVWNLGLEYIAIIKNFRWFFYKIQVPKLFWLKSNMIIFPILIFKNLMQKAICKFHIPYCFQVYTVPQAHKKFLLAFSFHRYNISLKNHTFSHWKFYDQNNKKRLDFHLISHIFFSLFD